jgi:hypothetical protein
MSTRTGIRKEGATGIIFVPVRMIMINRRGIESVDSADIHRRFRDEPPRFGRRGRRREIE